MKGHVYHRGNTWSYLFNIDPDPLTGKRQQANGSGFKTERAAWTACRAAMKEYEEDSRVEPSKRRVEEALAEWLTRIKHSIKPSMWQHWRDYADYYVIPHIGKRKLQDIDGAVLDALYAKLLAEGRRKTDNNSRMYEHWLANKDAKPADLVKACGVTIHAARSALTRYRAGRIPQAHAHGVAPKTVVNAHRCCTGPGRTSRPGNGSTATQPRKLTRRPPPPQGPEGVERCPAAYLPGRRPP
jgi:hypothetical protein